MDRIEKTIEDTGRAILASLEYKSYPEALLNKSIADIDMILQNEENIQALENLLRQRGNECILLYVSNILYNLKTKSKLSLSPDVIKWLASVWRNFLNRLQVYQSLFEEIDTYRIIMKPYFPGEGTIVTQISNAHQLTEDFIGDEEKEKKLKGIAHFFSSINELLTWMKPTYFFMLDFYYEQKLSGIGDTNLAERHEKIGLAGYGTLGYTYLDLTLLSLQALAILEAVYLIMKKKDRGKSLVTIDGKQKFLTMPEIYDIYRDKFNAMKKEVISLKQT